MKLPWNERPPMDTKKMMIGLIVCSVPAFLFLWFVMGRTQDKICACIVSPLCCIIGIAAHLKSRRDDRKAVHRAEEILDGSYFRSPEWREAYLQFKETHGYETCHERGMQYDLMRRYRRKTEPITFMALSGLLMAGCVCGLVTAYDKLETWLIVPVGFVIFGYLFWLHWSEFTARPVRKWLKAAASDPNFPAYEKSYLHGRILSFQAQGVVNGMNLGATHILLYNKEDVHTVELGVAEKMTREVVRVKEYVNEVYGRQHYRHYAVLHVRTAQGYFMLKTELNEFQVELAIEEFSRLRGLQTSPAAVRDGFINDNL